MSRAGRAGRMRHGIGSASRANVAGERAGPVPKWLGAMAEPVYRAAIARRNRGFDAGRRDKVELPVVSVGNLSVGGPARRRW